VYSYGFTGLVQMSGTTVAQRCKLVFNAIFNAMRTLPDLTRIYLYVVVVVELYLSTLTPSTVADFHGGRVPENYFTCRI
jgi:hypothetical protein